MKKEFHQILREKIQETESSRPSHGPTTPTTADPLHLAFLLGQIEKTQVSTPNRSQNYLSFAQNFPSSSAPNKNQTQSYCDLPIPPTPPTYFNLQQKNAWLWFWKRGAPLNEKFTHQDLQKQFRKLAQALHPDKNSHPKACETFILLREHYHHLTALS